ncbi:MAG: NAD(P)H-hydrate dehydratase [Bacteroidota bacterium]
MKIPNPGQIRLADAFTIKNTPISSIRLMEQAAEKLFNTIAALEAAPAAVYFIFCGPGNNGGDGLALCRLLLNAGLNAKAYVLPAPEAGYTKDMEENLRRLRKTDALALSELSSAKDLPGISADDFAIDALFGSGLSRPLNSLAAAVVKHLNDSPAFRIAIDTPSGLVADAHTPVENTVFRADITLALHAPRLSFMMPGNEKYTGEFMVLDIGILPAAFEEGEYPFSFTQAEDVVPMLKTRRKFSHKGTFGRALLVGGSEGKMGAIILATRACLKTGAGLVTAYIPRCGLVPMQSAIAEAMAIADENKPFIVHAPPVGNFTAFALGPGMGREEKTAKAFLAFLEKATTPLVLDADALNILADNPDMLFYVPKNSILTPHPKEFERLAGASANDFEALYKLQDFSIRHEVFVVLKGAYTAVCDPAGNVAFNSTGNPGMATPGSGDTLTGMICALLAQGYTPHESAVLGVYLHGLAGNLAAEETGYEALNATDIINYIGKAFLALRGGV